MLLFSSTTIGSDIYKEVGKQLWSNRTQGNNFIPAKDAATVAGVTPKTYRGWERGRSAPDLVQAKRLNAAFGWEFEVMSPEKKERLALLILKECSGINPDIEEALALIQVLDENYGLTSSLNLETAVTELILVSLELKLTRP